MGELKAQEPDFYFSCDQQSDARQGHVEITYNAFRSLEETERVHLLERLQDIYPPTVARRDRISPEAISKYEEQDYPSWISQCQESLGLVNWIVQLEHCPELTVSIQNNGSRPATNVLVEIRASGNFGLTTPMSELREFELIPVMERPKSPDQPQPLAGLATILNNLTESSLLALPEF